MTASALGNMNAAHASQTAMSKASLSSIVGKIGNLVATDSVTQESLSEISNKTVDTAVVEAVNNLVGDKDVSRSDAEAEGDDGEN
jgi:hypothetical protein